MRSKVQYEGFEDGEYIEEKERTFEEIIELIQAFPFKYDAKKQLIFAAENAICLELENGDFFKIMSFHENRFEVWYYSIADSFFYSYELKGIEDLKIMLRDIYSNQKLDIEKYPATSRKSNKQIFESFYTKDFKYSTRKRWHKFLFFSCSLEVISLILSVLFLILAFFEDQMIRGFWLFITFSLPGLLVYLNYYYKSKDYLLILSKGNSTFQFGQSNSLQTFCKDDIKGFEEVGITHRKSLLNQFYYLIIKMKDGTQIVIPNIIISESDLMRIFPRLTGYTRKKNPIIFQQALVSKN